MTVVPNELTHIQSFNRILFKALAFNDATGSFLIHWRLTLREHVWPCYTEHAHSTAKGTSGI